MIDITSLLIYFNRVAETVRIGSYDFNVIVHQNEDGDSFSINVKVRQQDTKEEHLIKFRVGIGRHKLSKSAVHDPAKPHFELDYYSVNKDSFSATLYFEFDNPTDEQLMGYAKGTIVIIARMMRNFFQKHGIGLEQLPEIISENLIYAELSESEPVLIQALYDCYLNSNLIVRQKGRDPLIIKTKHNLQKYLGLGDLQPLCQKLLEKMN